MNFFRKKRKLQNSCLIFSLFKCNCARSFKMLNYIYFFSEQSIYPKHRPDSFISLHNKTQMEVSSQILLKKLKQSIKNTVFVKSPNFFNSDKREQLLISFLNLLNMFIFYRFDVKLSILTLLFYGKGI